MNRKCSVGLVVTLGVFGFNWVSFYPSCYGASKDNKEWQMAVDCHHVVVSCGYVTAEYYILVDRLTCTTSLSVQGLYTAFRLIGGRNGGVGGGFRYCWR